ncbi:ATP-binding protein [Ectothiorhodospiraceae bacterium BW-2]|nr:ATP-binding protein [Ectothiorhodospiraceae bacterium BW-2]
MAQQQPHRIAKRYFNTTGPCFPDHHYMVDPLKRLKGVEQLIEQGQYFVIHAPRQSGKTTYAFALMEKLNREGVYTVLISSIQPAAQGQNPIEAMKIAAMCIAKDSRLYLPEAEWSPEVDRGEQGAEDGLLSYLQQWSLNNPKPIVLLLDEVDSLQDDNFLALLYQLRSGFVGRYKQGFPHAMGLIGLRDVRDYKIRLRPDSQSMGTGSPFNIKAESLFVDRLTEEEIVTLLQQHSEATGQPFEPQAIATLAELTQGQAWLVNALAHHIVQRLLEGDVGQIITEAHVWQAKEALILRRDTHLDSLIDKLKEPQVREVITAVINGSAPNFDHYNDAILYCRNLGLIAPHPPVRFANPIYQEIIPRVLSFGFQESIPQDYADPHWYIQQGRLDMEALLKAFQEFYREHSEAWLEKYDFREVGRQLLLMAFLQRVVNGGGRIEREMAVGNGRSDLIVEYGDERFVLELKLKRSEWDESKGLKQLARYLDRLNESTGYLLLFELDSAKSWEERIRWQRLTEAGRQLIVVGM